MHFYHLHALDWVDVVSALKADPKATSALAQSISSYAKSSPGYFADVQKKVKTFVDRGSWAFSPTPTGAIRPTSCRPKPT
jgi:hydrogenase large subunit